jgi:hypothetical protein
LRGGLRRFGLPTPVNELGCDYRCAPRAGSFAGSTSLAHSVSFQSGTGVGNLGRGTNAERATS